MKLYVKAARVPKMVEEIVLQGNYGYGWDDLTAYESSSQGMKEAKIDERSYIENEHIPTRIIRRKVPNPAYDPKADSLYSNLTKKWNDIENVIGDEDFRVTVKRYVGVAYDDASSPTAIENFIRSVVTGDAEYAHESGDDEIFDWVGYLDMIRKSIRDKDEIIAGQSDYGYIPTTISWTFTRYGMPNVVVLHMVF